MTSDEAAAVKAEVLSCGRVRAAEGVALPFRLSRSTAGPGAGSAGVALSFLGTRVKLSVSRDADAMELRRSGDAYALYMGERLLADGVEIVPLSHHAPGQAFFNLDSRCVMGCLFCSSPHLGISFSKGLTPRKVAELAVEAHDADGIDAVAVTSGVPDDVASTVERLAETVRLIRARLPNASIGVEPYIDADGQVDLLKAAGADEIKINVETYDRALFPKVCPGKNLDEVMRSIRYACQVFGRGRVASNILVGLGETDENVLQAVEDLGRSGCVPTLRALRINGPNAEALRALGAREPSGERMVSLAKAQREILKRHGLSPETFGTMCHKCGCCDIVPFVDVR